MKKVISVLLTVCIALSAISAGFVSVYAEGPEYIIENSDVTWNYRLPVYKTEEDGNSVLEEGGVLTFSGLGSIPDFPYTEKDGEIVPTAPWSDRDFSTVIFGDGIAAIGNYAFCCCTSLENITVPESVAVIGEGTFMNCTSLKSASILSSADISDEMFSGCTKLENVSFENPGKVIGKSAFSNCSSLKEITVPDGIETISDDAFSYCTALEKVVLPDSVKNIGQYAFYGCTNLKEIDFGSGLEKIGGSAFSGCLALENVALPESVKSISSSAFYGCTALSKVYLPENLTDIGESAFNLCNELKNIKIGYFTSEIGDMALGFGKRGSKIADFTVSGYNGTAAEKYASDNGFEFESLGNYYDGSCGETASWSFDAETGILSVGGTGGMFDYAENNLPAYSRFAGKINGIEIGEEITAIGAYAFYNMSVSGMLVPETVAEIGEKAIGNYSDGAVDSSFSFSGYRDTAAADYAEENIISFTDLRPVVTEGSCGENITWSYDAEEKTFTLSGTGATFDYKLTKLPEYAKFGFDIENIVVGDGITKIGDYALVFAKNAPAAITFTKDIAEFGTKPLGFIREAGENGYETSEIEGFTVNGYYKTPAKTFADENGFRFAPLAEAEPVEKVLEDSFAARVSEDGLIYIYQTELEKTALLEALGYAGYDSASVSADVIATGTTLEITDGDETKSYTFIVPGDTDGNGKINSSDALAILNHAVEKSIMTGDAFEAADIADDGVINSVDALYVLQVSVGQKELNSFLKSE